MNIHNKITLKCLAHKQKKIVKLRVQMPWTDTVLNLQLPTFFQLKCCQMYNYYQLRDMQLTELKSKFVNACSFSVVETKQIAWLINVDFLICFCFTKYTSLLLCDNLCCLKLCRMMIRKWNLLWLLPHNQLLQQRLIKVGLYRDHNVKIMNSWLYTISE